MQGEMEPLYPESRVHEIAKKAAHEAVEEAFSRCGISFDDPVRLRRQFLILDAMADDDERMEDNLFIRKFRKRCESWAGYVGAGVIGLFLAAIGTLLALGFRSWTGVFPPPPPH